MVDNLSNQSATVADDINFVQDLDDHISFEEELDISEEELSKTLPAEQFEITDLIDTHDEITPNSTTSDAQQSIVVTESSNELNQDQEQINQELDQLPTAEPVVKYSDTVDIYDYNNRPIEPYAYVRFSNEAITLRRSLESLVPFFQKGVLCYHDPLPGIEEDGSFAIAQEFVKKHPGFKLVKYPFPVIFHNWSKMAEYLFTKVRRVWLLDVFYNFALYYLKELAKVNGDEDRCWLFKVDTDHIYCQKSLEVAYKFALDNPHYNSLLCYKFNVARDIRNPDNPPMWFEALENGLDHFFTRLDIFQPFNFIYKFDDESVPEEQREISCWERAIFDLDKVSHCVNRYFVTSFHFNKEKYFYYNKGANLDKVFSRGFPYANMDFEDLIKNSPEVAADPYFYSEAHLKSLFDEFEYQDKDQMLKYGRDGFDYEELFNNPKYTTDTIVKEINNRANQMRNGEIPSTAEEIEDIEILRRVLNTIMSNQVMQNVVRMS